MIVRRTKIFSKTKLKHVKSNKGAESISGLAGVMAGKKAANKADEDEKSDIEIIKEAKKAGKKAGGAAGTIVGTGLAGISTYKSIKSINKAVKWAQKNSEQATKYTTVGKWIGDLGEKAVKFIRSPKEAEKVMEKVSKATQTADKVARHVSKNALKYGEAAKIGTIGLSVLTPLSLRAAGKRKGERAAERNTVSRLENRYDIDNDKKKGEKES